MRMQKLKQLVTSRKTFIWANIFLWLYEIFFTLSVWGLIPGLGTHFGAGLGDLAFAFFVTCLLLFHTVILFILGVVEAPKMAFAMLCLSSFLLFMGFHAMAIQGNLKDYSSYGNAHGLYYDRLKKK